MYNENQKLFSFLSSERCNAAILTCDGTLDGAEDAVKQKNVYEAADDIAEKTHTTTHPSPSPNTKNVQK